MQKSDKILKQIIQEQLAPAIIIEVITEETEDHEGYPILRIKVVCKPVNDRLDPEKVLDLHLHPIINELSSDCYPVFSYMTPEEAKFATD